MKTANELLKGTKGVTEADKKFVDKYILKFVFEEQTKIASWNGARADTTPLIAALVRFVQEMSENEFNAWVLKKYGISEGGKIQAFDRARYLILKLDKNIYSEFID